MPKTFFENRLRKPLLKSFRSSAHRFVDENESKVITLAKGKVFATAYYKDGRIEYRNIGDNLIVSSAGNILAQLCRGYTGGDPSVDPAVTGISDGPTFGITHMALGNVGPLLNPASPQLTDSALSSEYFRKAITQTQYINESDGTQAATVTNVVDFITTFEVGEPEGSLTEIGLFGGIDNSGVPASSGGGILFSRRTFPVWSLDDSTSVTFTWRIYF